MAQIQTNAGALGANTVFAPAGGAGGGRRRQWTVLGLAVVGVAVVAIGALLYGRAQDVPTSTTPSIVVGVAAEQQALDHYAPGGSVYQQQVPAAARVEAASGTSHYAPGGSVYQQQVPAAAIRAEAASGGSVYQQQVPAAATRAEAAPGGSTYQQ